MTSTEWLLDKVNDPIGTEDLTPLYEEYCQFQGTHIKADSFSRMCRTAMQKYREKLSEDNSTTESLKSVEVLLDTINETDNKLEIALRSYKIKDVEVAAKIAGIDLTKWKCTRKRVRASQNVNNPYFIVL